jgi:hypothetical protein
MNLSFELNKDNNLEIHGDKIGFEYLLKNIKKITQNNDDHLHLSTSEFGGKLSNNIYGINNKKINSIKLCYWKTDE